MMERWELVHAYSLKEVTFHTNLLYDDDMMLFCKAIQTNVKNIIKFLELYSGRLLDKL